MVRDARDVCGSRVQRAGREEQYCMVMSRSAAGARTTLGARTDIARGGIAYSHREILFLFFRITMIYRGNILLTYYDHRRIPKLLVIYEEHKCLLSERQLCSS